MGLRVLGLGFEFGFRLEVFMDWSLGCLQGKGSGFPSLLLELLEPRAAISPSTSLKTTRTNPNRAIHVSDVQAFRSIGVEDAGSFRPPRSRFCAG